MEKNRVEDIFANLVLNNMARGVPREQAIEDAKKAVEEIIKTSEQLTKLVEKPE